MTRLYPGDHKMIRTIANTLYKNNDSTHHPLSPGDGLKIPASGTEALPGLFLNNFLTLCLSGNKLQINQSMIQEWFTVKYSTYI